MRTGLDADGLIVALRRAGSIVLFGVLPVVVVVAVLAATFHNRFVYDFHGVLYDGGRAVREGSDPYPVAFLAHAAAAHSAGRPTSTVFAVPVYPAPALVAAVPVSLLPFHLAGILYTGLSIVAMIAGLWLLGVRDWRCYGVSFLSWPLLDSLRLGQVNALLILGTGAVWYWRRQLVAPALALASIVAVNLFLWPLGFFMLITNRFRVAALSVLLFVVAALAGWAVIGFGTLSSYPRMLSNLSSVEAGSGVSNLSAGLALGISRDAGQVLAAAITVAILALALVFVRRPGGEPRAFGLAIMAGLASSPVVWPHYFVLVFAAIARPLAEPLPSLADPTDRVRRTDRPNPRRHLEDRSRIIAIEAITITALCSWPIDSELSPLRRRSDSDAPGLLQHTRSPHASREGAVQAAVASAGCAGHRRR